MICHFFNRFRKRFLVTISNLASGTFSKIYFFAVNGLLVKIDFLCQQIVFEIKKALNVSFLMTISIVILNASQFRSIYFRRAELLSSDRPIQGWIPEIKKSIIKNPILIIFKYGLTWEMIITLLFHGILRSWHFKDMFCLHT